MINKWILDNFKSIDKEKNLEFRPLTIFTGANSSGKSTVLQSILLLTQTLQNQIHSRSIVLNGSIKRFGSYDDVVYRRDCTKDIKIGFSLKRDPKKRSHRYAPWEEEVSEVDCRFAVTMKGQRDSLQPALKTLSIKRKDLYGRVGNLKIYKRNKNTYQQEQRIIDHCDLQIAPADREYRLRSDVKSQVVFNGQPYSHNNLGVRMSHFLPEIVFNYRSTTDLVRRFVSEVVDGESLFDINESLFGKLPQGFKERTIEIAKEIQRKGALGPDGVKHYSKLLERIKREWSTSNFWAVFGFANLDKEQKMRYKNLLIAEIKNLPEEYSIDRIPAAFFYPGIELVKDYFANRIKYLGPLREEPRSLYPINSMGSTDVGLKGENTAAVFEINKEKKIPFVDPSLFGDPKSGSMEPKEVTLAEAVNSWLVYLGVAEKIETNDLGKIGHELKITTDIEEMEQDLTHVGVGVSQVLPILVMALLAEEDDVIILEQPELHLHPRVQSRLADFFVTMNALGKQCIVETHSEYLINRLRYLVAKSDDRKIADDTLIYFVEKEAGHSVYREITINEYGKIDEWPKGFFDEGENLASLTFKAAMEKKRQRKQQEGK